MTDNRSGISEYRDGHWLSAKPLPYPASLREKLLHLFGQHVFYGHKACLLCGKDHPDAENA